MNIYFQVCEHRRYVRTCVGRCPHWRPRHQAQVSRGDVVPVAREQATVVHLAAALVGAPYSRLPRLSRGRAEGGHGET